MRTAQCFLRKVGLELAQRDAGQNVGDFESPWLAYLYLMRSALLAATLAAAPLVCTATTATCTLLAEGATDKILRLDGACDTRSAPMSTFKLAISLMGYDAGILKDERAPVLPFKPGYVDWRDEWKQDIDPTQWMTLSVVWYSQQITLRLGETRFSRYTHQFKYGNEDVSGGLSKAWLNTSLAITPREQIAFLGRLVRRELGVSAHAYQMTANISLFGPLANGWTVHGKTGAGGYGRDGKVGWYVGWAEKAGRSITFARQRLESDKELDGPAGVRARDSLLAELPAMLDAIK